MSSAATVQPATITAQPMNATNGAPEEHAPRHHHPQPPPSDNMFKISTDTKDRDPRKMNQHLRLVFNDVIGEPEPGTYSFDKVWHLSYQSFSVTKLWCYRILSLIFAIPCAIYWAITFACLAFCHIWCCMPCIRSCRIQLHYVREMYDIIMSTFCAPFVDAMGRCFSHIRITMTNKPANDIVEVRTKPNDMHAV